MSASPSIDASELAKFAQLADRWWDVNGPFAPLHRINPIRLAFIREVVAAAFERDERGLRPFGGLSLLDLGCGGGLLAEPAARLGFSVTASDAAEENVRAAAAHAIRSGLIIEYQCSTVEQLAVEGRRFDVVLAMEVVEHVPEPVQFLKTAAGLVRVGGLLVMSTINQTIRSLLFAKVAAEYILRWVPVGTHDWQKFVRPEVLQTFLDRAGFRVLRTEGLSFNSLTSGWFLSRDITMNYFIAARRLSN